MEDTLVPIFVVGGSFAMTIAIVGIVVWARHRAREMRHQTIRLALEKGQPLPPDLLRDAERHPRGSDLQRGILFFFLGSGISAFLWLKDNRNWGAGLILVALGVGYLVAHWVSPRRKAEEPGKS